MTNAKPMTAERLKRKSLTIREGADGEPDIFVHSDPDGEWVLYRNAQAVIDALTRDNAALAAERDRLNEALTPSGNTKSAYIGEFSFDEKSDDSRGTVTRTVPWTTIKEIMAAIRARADASGALNRSNP